MENCSKDAQQEIQQVEEIAREKKKQISDEEI